MESFGDKQGKEGGGGTVAVPCAFSSKTQRYVHLFFIFVFQARIAEIREKYREKLLSANARLVELGQPTHSFDGIVFGM